MCWTLLDFLCLIERPQKHLRVAGIKIPSAIQSTNQKRRTILQFLLGRSSEGEKKEYLFKVLVIGDLGVGKTSIIKRYVHQFFSVHYRATIGVDFALKVINWDENTLVRLQLWDIAGQERFGNMTRVYYKEAVAAFIVFDVTRASTFEAVQKWKNDLDSKVTLPTGEPVPAVLLANKCDQAKEGLVNNCSQMDEYCSDKGFIGWFETSAKEDINVAEAAQFLVSKILENEKAHNFEDMPKDPEAISLTALKSGTSGGMNKQGAKYGQTEPQKSGCC